MYDECRTKWGDQIHASGRGQKKPPNFFEGYKTTHMNTNQILV